MTQYATNQSRDTLYQQFEDALGKVGGVCHQAEAMSDAASMIARIAEASPESGRAIWTAPMVRDAMPELVAALQSNGCEVRYPASPADVRDQPFGLSVARQAIAETGSVVLVERELPDRVVGLMTETHIVVCPTSQLSASLDDAATTLAEAASELGSYATLVTGPSRTADIERQLTVGVQGPAKMHVILINEPT